MRTDWRGFLGLLACAVGVLALPGRGRGERPRDRRARRRAGPPDRLRAGRVMATDLTDLEISEVSIVDLPANKGARVVLWKSDRRTSRRRRPAPDADDGEDFESFMSRLEEADGGENEMSKTLADAIAKGG